MRGDAVKVLDHGLVRLVDYMGTDLSVVRAARVSHSADWRTGDDAGKDEKLVRYLMQHRHTTPFESVVFTFEIKAPIFVFRQWHRHRTQSYNEVSARYTILPEEFYVPEVGVIGEQSKDNKQARDLTPELTPGQGKVARTMQVRKYEKHCKTAYALYLELAEDGWPKELARAVLPFAMYSRMFTTLNLHNLFHFLGLRIHPHAQYETRVFAQSVLNFIVPLVPLAVQAWLESKQSWEQYQSMLEFMPILKELMSLGDEEEAVRLFIELRKKVLL